MQTTNIEQLKINRLTQEQYDAAKQAGTLSANEMYLTPDEEIVFNTAYNATTNKAATMTDVREAVEEKADTSNSVQITLLANAWNNGRQTVSVTGLKANQNGIATVSQNCSSEEYDALTAAEIYVSGQNVNSLSFTANGEIPQINIPITVILLG